MVTETTDRWFLVACLPLLLGGPAVWWMAESWTDWFYGALAIWTGCVNALTIIVGMKHGN